MEQTKRKPPKRRSRAEIDELVAQWRASGKSLSKFAKEHGLAMSTLYQWIHPRKGRADEGKRRTRKRKPVSKAAFTEVKVVGQDGPRGSAMTVTLRGGNSVTFEGQAVEPAWLAAVLKVVSAC